MDDNISISSSGDTELDERLLRYIRRKIGRLNRFVPRSARASAHAEVRLKATKLGKQERFECEVILHLPQETMVAKEATVNFFAAVDIAEDKIKHQLNNYKTTKIGRRKRIGRFVSKLRRR